MRSTKKKGNAMNKGWLIRLAIFGTCVTPAVAWADPNGPSWNPEFGYEEGLTFGGGDLLVPGVTGQPLLTPSDMNLYAGDTIFLQGYYRQAIGHTGLSFKVAAGAAIGCAIPTCLDQLFDNNGGAYQFTTGTGDVAVEYAWDGGRIGVGRTARYLNAVTSASSVYAFQEVDLRPAYGWFMEYDYDRVGLRYTHIIYHSSSAYAVNGSNLGVYFHLNYHDEDWYPGGRYFDQGMGYARQGVTLMLHPKEWGF
jgi:hypothetical protein